MAGISIAASASRTLLFSHHKLFLSPISTHFLFTTHRNVTTSIRFSSTTTSNIATTLQSPHRTHNVIDILEKRGLLESLTSDNLRSLASTPNTPLKVYCGFDPTAESLHLGNLLGIIVLSWFLRCGHQAVALIGGATAKESVKKRLESEQGMSYTEFTYQLLQGYDFLHLFQNEGVNVQIGGSDQWGNITVGAELIRKILQSVVDGEAYGLTFPLLLKSDGTKFRKSEDSAIWLSPSMLSPYKFYQYFFSVPDADVIRFLKILTFLELEEVDELESSMKRPGYVPNTAQQRRAEEVTLFVHGEEGLNEALKATEALRPGAETKLDWKSIEAIAQDVPSCSLAYDQVVSLLLVDLSASAGLLDSKSAARRMLKQGGLYVNNNRDYSESKRIKPQDIVDGKVLLLSAGKKNTVVVWIS